MTKRQRRMLRFSLLPAMAAYVLVIRATVGLLWMTTLPTGSVFLLGVLVPVVIVAVILNKIGWM